MTKTLVIACALAVGSAIAASTTFTGRFIARTEWQHRKTVGASTLEETFGPFLTWTHETGTNANQMATVVSRNGTLTNGASVTIDMLDIDNGFGDNVSFSAIRFMAFRATGGELQIGGAATNEFASWLGGTNDTVKVRAGGLALFVAPDLTGYAVGTNGNIKILNTTTNTVTYSAYIGGSE